MPTISSIFLVLSLVLAVVIGPQTRPWSWGPAMLALGVSVAAALPSIWRKGRSQADFVVIGFSLLTAGWFALRAWISPVAEYGQADMLLLCAAVATFVSVRGIMGDLRAERILAWGIALLLLANLVVIGIQITDPSYSPVFCSRAGPKMISGFFAHYNETANYLIASSLLVGGFALMGRHSLATRVLFSLLAVGGLAGVWFTTSRGGILGAAFGCGIFAVILLVIGYRKKAKWFAPALITLPVIGGIAIAAFLFMGWESAQETRKAADTSVNALLDNDCRLYFLGLAMSCIGQHPMEGGGSRSFSWECYQKWDSNANDFGYARPDMVHNELVQSATDYGLIGMGLLVGLLGTFLIACLLRAMFEKLPASPDSTDAWRLGGCAALIGMLVQSSFSFVFHLLPGILLLGICLGMMSRTGVPGSGVRAAGTRIFLTIPALACLWLLFAVGFKGTQVTRILWSTYFSKSGVLGGESQIDALTEAIAVWPTSEFHQHRGDQLRKAMDTQSVTEAKSLAERALKDYQESARLLSFEPYPVVSAANLLSYLQRDDEAEAVFQRAIELQGGMEPAFRSRYSLAIHLFRKGIRMHGSATPEKLLSIFERSADELEHAAKETPAWVIGNDPDSPRVSIHESLGVAREAAEDPKGALEAYNFAATLRNGTRAHYRAGVLLGKQAIAMWSKRRAAEAMYGFIEARKRVMQAGNQLPQGVSPSDRVEYIDYLDRSINFLKGAKIEPKEW